MKKLQIKNVYDKKINKSQIHSRKNGAIVSLQDFLNDWAHHFFVNDNLSGVWTKYLVEGERFCARLVSRVLYFHLNFAFS